MAVLPQQGLQFRCHFGWEWPEEDKEGEKRGGYEEEEENEGKEKNDEDI